MTAIDRRQVVRELLHKFSERILARIPDMPDDWNSLQIRQYMADVASEGLLRPMTKIEYNDYLYDVENNQLLEKNYG